MIDLGRLRALHAVAHVRLGQSGAAEVLGYTPSAVSQQFAKLERRRGTTLVERQGRGIVLDRRRPRQLASTAAQGPRRWSRMPS